MTVIFDSDVAVKVGIREAILLEAIRYWTAKNEANGKHFHDGRFWTYNSLDAWSKMYPFLSKDQVRTVIRNLTEKGLVMVGNYNSKATDRTAWYALTDKAVSMLENSHMEVVEIPHGSGENPTSLFNNQDNTKALTKKDEGFDKFWKAYPKKMNKADALKAWSKVDVPVDTIVQAVEAQKKTSQWTKDNGQFIPYPATWLRGRRWENEVETEPINQSVSLVDLAIKKRRKQ